MHTEIKELVAIVNGKEVAVRFEEIKIDTKWQIKGSLPVRIAVNSVNKIIKSWVRRRNMYQAQLAYAEIEKMGVKEDMKVQGATPYQRLNPDDYNKKQQPGVNMVNRGFGFLEKKADPELNKELKYVNSDIKYYDKKSKKALQRINFYQHYMSNDFFRIRDRFKLPIRRLAHDIGAAFQRVSGINLTGSKLDPRTDLIPPTMPPKNTDLTLVSVPEKEQDRSIDVADLIGKPENDKFLVKTLRNIVNNVEEKKSNPMVELKEIRTVTLDKAEEKAHTSNQTPPTEEKAHKEAEEKKLEGVEKKNTGYSTDNKPKEEKAEASINTPKFTTEYTKKLTDNLLSDVNKAFSNGVTDVVSKSLAPILQGFIEQITLLEQGLIDGAKQRAQIVEADLIARAKRDAEAFKVELMKEVQDNITMAVSQVLKNPPMPPAQPTDEINKAL